MPTEYHLVNSNDIKPEMKFNKENVMDIYRNLLNIRIMEEYANMKYKSNAIRGFCHLVIGQENIYVSLMNVLGEDDKVIGSYRCHGLAYACGIKMENIIGELLGKEIGNCKGKGGSMHLYNDKFYGGHGIVGAQVSLGLGIAFALKYKETRGVSFVFYGDGASNQGQVFESFNMALLWKLPIIFICENNQYGMWTPDKNVCSNREYFKRGCNIPGIKVEDTNILELIDVLSYCKKFALEKGPIILQIDTYRTCGHSCVDVTEFYRSQVEKEKRMKQDCVRCFRNIVMDYCKEDEITKLEKEISSNFEKIVEKVMNSKNPLCDELYTDVLL